VGERSDSCRDEDGRLTLLPQRSVERCDKCASEEYCLAQPTGAVCGVLPPQCEEKAERTCDCFTRSHNLGKVSCREADGRLELTRL
jgi:hypothetical protein